MTLWHQLHFEGGVDIYQLAKLAHYNRPGIFKTSEDLLFLYCALEAYVTNNGTTIPSPVDIDAWRNSASGYQLNGCVRVSRVYTDSVAKVHFVLFTLFLGYIKNQIVFCNENTRLVSRWT